MTSSQPSESISPWALQWALALVLVCGLTLGYFIMRTYASPIQRQYQLDFGDAQWIAPPETAPIAYFRQEIYLNAEPELAWLEVSATDNYKLIVNGHTSGNEASLKTRVAGIYDIKKPLKPGKNVIAVSISRTSYPGSAQLLLKGLVKEPGGKTTPITSDESWRVATETGIVPGSEDWTSPVVEDELWPKARPATINEPLHIRWVNTNPLLLQLPKVGQWIMSENAATESVFSTTLNASKARQETWIQVASSGELDLLVNGHFVTSSVEAVTAQKRLPHLAATKVVSPAKSSQTTALGLPKKPAPFEKAVLEAYDISYWIKKGSNSIVSAVRSDPHPASFFANGFLVGPDGNVEQFGSDSHWQMGDVSSGSQTTDNLRPVEIGRDGTAPWGYLEQEMARPLDLSGFATVAKTGAIILATVFGIAFLWLLLSWFVSASLREAFQRVLVRDALFHGLLTAGLLLLFLFDFDPRFPDNWAFQPLLVVGAISTLIIFRLFHLLADRQVAWHLKTRLEEIRGISVRQALPYLLLVLIMSLGLGLRYQNLGFMSFDHDEMGLVVKSKGIYKLGIPYTEFAGDVRPLTTYELVPYSQALSGLIFGYSEWSMRLPSCLMGTLCIGVLALMGRRLFDWRTGLIAAFLYACIPLNIRWAQNAFYPQQGQLMAMLTIWLFYEAFSVRPLQRKYLTGASIAFAATYLSWEGTGFMLPALFMGLVVIRWGEWWWLKEFHLYRCLFFIAALVVAQYCWRTLAGWPYLQVGSGLSNLTGPSLFFLTAGYEPMFYIDKLVLSENHVFFTVMIIIGLPFCWDQRGFRYIMAVFVTLLILHTNFLAALSPRYCYYYQPLLILGGIAAAVMLYDRLISLARGEGNSIVARGFVHATGVAVVALLFLQSNDWLLKDYTLSSTGDTPGLMTRLGTYRYDYRGAAQYIMSRVQPGDQIIAGIPHVFQWYAGRPGDYFLDTLLSSKVPYNQTLAEPRFADKFGGLPTIRNLTELEEVTHRARRTWIVFAPYSAFEKFSSPDVLEYLDKNMKVVFESYRAKVLLVEGANQAPSVAQSP